MLEAALTQDLALLAALTQGETKSMVLRSVISHPQADCNLFAAAPDWSVPSLQEPSHLLDGADSALSVLPVLRANSTFTFNCIGTLSGCRTSLVPLMRCVSGAWCAPLTRSSRCASLLPCQHASAQRLWPCSPG